MISVILPINEAFPRFYNRVYYYKSLSKFFKAWENFTKRPYLFLENDLHLNVCSVNFGKLFNDAVIEISLNHRDTSTDHTP